MLEEFFVTCLESHQRALTIFKDGTYQITSVMVPLLKTAEGKFIASYPDHYIVWDQCFYLDRIDRKNNTIVLKERV